MKKEVISAVDFLVDLLRINSKPAVLSEEKLLKFRHHAIECLWQHYQNHWFPESPLKGSGYRCIRINGKMDPLIARAGELVGLANSKLRAMFPSELTMWIDPREVSYRIGENGSICNIFVKSGGSAGSTAVEAKPQEESSPVKAATVKQQAPSSPQLTIQQLKQQQLQQQQFSPSKSTASSVQYQSPPRSPIFSNSQQHQMSLQQQQHLAMFLMNNHTAGNCKDSLRSCALESSTRGLERLFVSS